MKENKTDVIKFRVSDSERAQIQALADKRTNGNISSLIKNLLYAAMREEEERSMSMNLVYKTAYMEGRMDTDTCVIIGVIPNAEREIVGRKMTKEERAAILTAYADDFEDGSNHFDGTYEWLGRAGVTIRRKVVLAAKMFSVPEDEQADWDGLNIVTASEISWKAFVTGRPIGELIRNMTQIDSQVQ